MVDPNAVENKCVKPAWKTIRKQRLITQREAKALLARARELQARQQEVGQDGSERASE